MPEYVNANPNRLVELDDVDDSVVPDVGDVLTFGENNKYAPQAPQGGGGDLGAAVILAPVEDGRNHIAGTQGEVFGVEAVPDGGEAGDGSAFAVSPDLIYFRHQVPNAGTYVELSVGDTGNGDEWGGSVGNNGSLATHSLHAAGALMGFKNQDPGDKFRLRVGDGFVAFTQDLDAGGGETDILNVTPSTFGAFGVSPSPQVAYVADPTDLTSAIAAIITLRDALVAFGFMAPA